MLALMLTIFTLVGAETAARCMGYAPLRMPPLDIRVEPGGRLFTRDPKLGYRPLAGSYRITLETGYPFRATHDTQGRRITHPAHITSVARPEFWLFGCSFAYGYSANDEETAAWQLQEQMPEYEIVNFGAPGYGTIHSVIQLREALAAGRRAKAAIVLYGNFHEERNGFLRRRQKTVMLYNRLGPMVQPYATLSSDGRLVYHATPVEYRELPLQRHSALINALDEAIIEYDARHTPSAELTRLLLVEFADLCKQHGVVPCVAGLRPNSKTRAMLEACRAAGIPVADISFDWEQPTNWNAPADPKHPSRRGHREYADKLHLLLASDLLLEDQLARLRDNPRDDAANLYVGIGQLREGNIEVARKHLSLVVELNPGDARGHYWLAQACSRNGDNQKAETELCEAIARDGDYAEARMALGMLHLHEGRKRAAADELKQVLSLRPGWHQTANALAWVLATAREPDVRNPKLALELADDACRVTRSEHASDLDTLAAAQAACGQLDQAVKTAERAIARAKATGQRELAAKCSARRAVYASGRAWEE
jgi:tetratricopeptide (TPR) repeat protein